MNRKTIKKQIADTLSLPVYSKYMGTATTDDPNKMIVPLGAVKRDPENAMLHPEKNMRGIRASLRRNGQTQPLVVDRDGVIAVGNGRHEAAELEGWTHIWIVTTGLTGVELRAMGINDNQTGRTGQWNEDRLPAHLRDIYAWVPENDDVLPFTDDDVGVFEEPELPILETDSVGGLGDLNDTYTPEASSPPPAPAEPKKRARAVKAPPPDADDRARNDLAINGITPNMRITIDQALDKVRYVCADMALTEGRCIELICADYIAGV